jgi:putative protein-disulfide isomerase
MPPASSTLFYVYDPMCSWCWGFRKTWESVTQRLPEHVDVKYLLGGLAPDSSDPMPQDMQISIRDTWRTIQKEIPGTEFNFDFWELCKPRRSTYPSCRAVIAIKKQKQLMEKAMILAIQEAYYLNARNPSDDDVLIDLACQLELDTEQFSNDLSSVETQNELMSEIQFSRELGAQGFPSLIFETKNSRKILQLDYNHPDAILNQIT